MSSHSEPCPKLPPPNSLLESYTDSPAKPRRPEEVLTLGTPIIRVLAPTPEGDHDIRAPIVLHPEPSTTDDVEKDADTWTDNLIKRMNAHKIESIFEHSSSSDDDSADDDDGMGFEDVASDDDEDDNDNDISDVASDDEDNGWPLKRYDTRSPPRSPSLPLNFHPAASSDPCHICNAPSDLRRAGEEVEEKGPYPSFSASSVSPYRGHVKLLQTSLTAPRAIWALGQRTILKELENDAVNGRLAYKARNLEFAAKHTIPSATNVVVPRVLSSWTEEEAEANDGFSSSSSFLFMSRIPGQTLEEAWSDLSPEAREDIARDVVAHLRAWHAVTSPSMSSVDGGVMLNVGTFFKKTPGGDGDGDGVGPFYSESEVWNHLVRVLESGGVDAADIGVLQSRMPPMAPFVFSHGDLSARHIMVEDEKFAGFADFSQSGFYPAWWEWVHLQDIDTLFDGQWKMVLRKHFAPPGDGVDFQRALNWYDYWTELQCDPTSKKAQQLIADLA